MKTKSIIVQNSAHACWICQRMPYSMQLKMKPAPYNTRYALQHTHHTALVQPAACIIVRALFSIAASAADDVPQAMHRKLSVRQWHDVDLEGQVGALTLNGSAFICFSSWLTFCCASATR